MHMSHVGNAHPDQAVVAYVFVLNRMNILCSRNEHRSRQPFFNDCLLSQTA